MGDRERLLAPERQVDEVDGRVGDRFDLIGAVHRIAGGNAAALVVLPEEYGRLLPVHPFAEVAERQGRRRRRRWRRGRGRRDRYGGGRWGGYEGLRGEEVGDLVGPRGAIQLVQIEVREARLRRGSIRGRWRSGLPRSIGLRVGWFFAAGHDARDEGVRHYNRGRPARNVAREGQLHGRSTCKVSRTWVSTARSLVRFLRKLN